MLKLDNEWQNRAQAREKRRPTVLKGISQDLKDSEIATKLGVNRWVIKSDIRFMKNNGDPELKHAQKAQELVQEKKRLDFIKEKKFTKHNDRFLNMTGMTLKEKSFRNMIDFHRHELTKILKSRDQNAAIKKLPKSVRRTLIHNGIITKGWRACEIDSNVRKYLRNITTKQ